MRQPYILLFFILIIITSAIKPVRNIKVSFRDNVYTIDDVTSVEELVARLGKESGISKKEMKSGKYKFFYKGKFLDRDDLLRQAGVRDGSNIFVVTENHPVKFRDALALVLESLDEELWEKFRHSLQKEKHVSFHDLLTEWKEIQYLTRQDVTSFLRNGLDIYYHSLRAWWENPLFRMTITDPDQIEKVRKIISMHLSQKILGPIATKLVHNPEMWRKQVLEISSAFIRLGDTFLDGLLDLLLDVLNGAGKTTAAARTRDAAGIHLNSHYQNDISTTITLDDPSLANNLLFELSESEGEDEE